MKLSLGFDGSVSVIPEDDKERAALAAFMETVEPCSVTICTQTGDKFKTMWIGRGDPNMGAAIAETMAAVMGAEVHDPHDKKQGRRW